MAWDGICDSVCPIAQTLSVVGERWTLLILRELSMGVNRFDGIQAQTGMSSHLLATRLKELEANGIIERKLYEEHPKRYEYHTTAKGKELDPVLMLLRSLGRKWAGESTKDEAVKLRLKGSGKLMTHLSQFPGPAESFRFSKLEGTIGPAFQAERDAKVEFFKKTRADGKAARKESASPVKKSTQPKAAAKRKSVVAAH